MTTEGIRALDISAHGKILTSSLSGFGCEENTKGSNGETLEKVCRNGPDGDRKSANLQPPAAMGVNGEATQNNSNPSNARCGDMVNVLHPSPAKDVAGAAASISKVEAAAPASLLQNSGCTSTVPPASEDGLRESATLSESCQNVIGPEERGVGIGMAIAAGIIMRSWGQEVYAREILGAAGLDTLENLKASGVDQYDIDVLIPVIATSTGGRE
jgi:hypothetical protein